jgi:hypothetical protein
MTANLHLDGTPLQDTDYAYPEMHTAVRLAMEKMHEP